MLTNYKNNKAGALLVLVLLLCSSLVSASAGLTTGETILDQTPNVVNTAFNAALEPGLFVVTGLVNGIRSFSTLSNSFQSQFQNKEQAQAQTTEVDIAKANLDNSKKNISTMFFFIVATFVILFDMIVSMFYILIIVLTVWVIFVGYVKFLIMIIDFISGRLEQRGIRK